MLGAAEIRELAKSLDLRPTKKLGQNFVIDPNTIRKIVAQANLNPDDLVVEIGPGLGSLTLGLFEVVDQVIAVEVDKRLADLLPQTISKYAPTKRFTVVQADALRIQDLPVQPTALVANLPYNVSVPVFLHLLEHFPTLRSGVVMVQAEVADRLAAKPNSKEYGIPSVKAAWWADVSGAGSVSRSIFWPAPNVDSKLVGFTRHAPLGDEVLRKKVFSIIDLAFAQRRKMLRSTLSSLYGSSAAAEAHLESVGIDGTLRGEALTIEDFCKIAQ